MAANEAIVMYLILRRDLTSALNWPVGALVAQGCHAATAILWQFREDDHVKTYMGAMDSMRKVVLEVADESQLRSTSEKLATANVEHKLWIEQPENVATCIAVKPYPKSVVQPLVKGLKLFS